MNKVPISVAIIAQDEEDNISKCIESVSWAEEIVVIDGGSADKTIEICKTLGARVIEHGWPGHIQQKNFAIDQCTRSWILSLDADERASDDLVRFIKQLFDSGDPDYDGYYFPRKVFYLGKWIKHSGWYPDYKLRLFRKSKSRWTGYNPHDRVELQGRSTRVKADILHYPYRSVRDHLDRINSYTSIMARELNSEGTRSNLLKIIFNPYFRFLRSYIFKLGFLDGFHGIIISILTSYYVFLKYLKLWELQVKQKEK